MNNNPESLTVRDMTFRFEGPLGFHLGPVNLSIPRGSVVFWTGHNGSGKSTLARVLCGELSAQKGSFVVPGASSIYHRQSIAENTFPDLTVGGHIRLLSRNDHGRLDALVDSFPEIAKLYRKYPDELSGGQLQLVGFATVLLENHGLYVFDEVFNHLDQENAAKVMRCIQDILVQRNNSICIVISHDLELVREMADLVHVFVDGKIAATLTRAELQRSDEVLIDLVIRRKVRQA